MPVTCQYTGCTFNNGTENCLHEDPDITLGSGSIAGLAACGSYRPKRSGVEDFTQEKRRAESD